MTPDQFKAWFEGFCEAIDVAPTPEQWAKIKAKVAEIREKPLVTMRDTDFRRTWLENDKTFDVVTPRYTTGPAQPPGPVGSPWIRGEIIADCGPIVPLSRESDKAADFPGSSSRGLL